MLVNMFDFEILCENVIQKHFYFIFRYRRNLDSGQMNSLGTFI